MWHDLPIDICCHLSHVSRKLQTGIPENDLSINKKRDFCFVCLSLAPPRSSVDAATRVARRF
jgi:hypothetical protein